MNSPKKHRSINNKTRAKLSTQMSLCFHLFLSWRAFTDFDYITIFKKYIFSIRFLFDVSYLSALFSYTNQEMSQNRGKVQTQGSPSLGIFGQRSPLRENRRQTAKETSTEVEPALNTSWLYFLCLNLFFPVLIPLNNDLKIDKIFLIKTIQRIC